MCGVVGVVLANEDVAPLLVDSLTTLQHRGQDAAGIATTDRQGRTKLLKGNGLVADVFKQEKDVQRLVGNYGLGHVRYPTAGSSNDAEAQPFYTNSPLGLCLGHNGNLTNTEQLREWCRNVAHRQVNTESDSELILVVFSHFLNAGTLANPEMVFNAVAKCMEMCHGAFAITISIRGVGIVGFRDPHGIRPLCFGERHDGAILASESVAVEIGGFHFTRDVQPGEAVLLSLSGEVTAHTCTQSSQLMPCIFEYVYFARPDSVMDGASVYQARVNMGEFLAQRVIMLHPESKIDIVVPVPSTSRVSAVQCAIKLGVPYVEGLVRNRYTGRTFIMPGQKKRTNSVRMKLNPVTSVIKGKAVLLVDDSIVRGTTSRHIVEILRAAGATKVFFASAAPAIRYPNVYGIDMPTSTELIAFNRDEAQVATAIGADWVVYQSLDDLQTAVKMCNPALSRFDMSCFDGVYCAGALPKGYFEKLHAQRSNDVLEQGVPARSGTASPGWPSPPTMSHAARKQKLDTSPNNHDMHVVPLQPL